MIFLKSQRGILFLDSPSTRASPVRGLAVPDIIEDVWVVNAVLRPSSGWCSLRRLLVDDHVEAVLVEYRATSLAHSQELLVSYLLPVLLLNDVELKAWRSIFLQSSGACFPFHCCRVTLIRPRLGSVVLPLAKIINAIICLVVKIVAPVNVLDRSGCMLLGGASWQTSLATLTILVKRVLQSGWPLLVDVSRCVWIIWRLVKKTNGAVQVLKLLVALGCRHLSNLRRQMKFIATGVLLIVELNAKQLVNVLIRLLFQCLKRCTYRV